MQVGIAQLAPVFLDRTATVQRVAEAVRDASGRGCRLVCFGEALVPGYPVWVERSGGARFNAADQKAIYAEYLHQGVDLDADHLDPIRDAARDGETAVVVGVMERPAARGGHTLYCTCVVIDPAGAIASAHRKLMPTYEERLVWGIGDGAGLVTHALGPFTLSALNCWENWMPLARTAMYAAGTTLHVAIWPGAVRNTHDITRFIAKEGRCFVISACGRLVGRDVPADVPHRASWIGDDDEVILEGGSCIAGPDGSWIVEPTPGETDLIVADLDPARVREERQNFDPVGHYARPDVLRLAVDRTRQSVII